MSADDTRSDPVRDAESDAPRRPHSSQTLLGLLLVVGILLVWRLAALLAVAVGAMVLAVALRGLAALLRRIVPINSNLAVLPVVGILLAVFGGVGWLFGAQIGAQFDLLFERLPAILARIEHGVAERYWGRWLIEQAQDVNLPGATGAFAAQIGTFFSSTLRGVAYAMLIFTGGIYFAVQPDRYRLGLLKLVPIAHRARAGEILALAGDTLQRWLIGQSIAMLAVGLLTTLRLSLLGVGAPFALGMISGLFAFVPYVGPILAVVPSLLMALTQSPMLALYTACLYGGVHLLESNVITPLVQNEAVELPPALTIFAAATFAILLGPVGILLAAPLTILLLVAVQTLYIEDTLGEKRTWPSDRAQGNH